MTADVENQTVSRTSVPSGKAVSHGIAPRKRGMRRAINAVGALLLLVGVGFYVYTTWFADGDPADRYTTAPVERGDIEESVTATGTLQPRDYVDVGTQVSGQLKVVHVQIGSTVKQGDLLAEID
ncbi:MAG TPA: biotin/lipoyl-binding protein, partial [Burkholderiales bacterium]